MITRRQFIVTGLAAAAAPSFAQDAYPSRPIRVIVPHAAGGGVDILARNLGEYIRPLLGQPFVVENKPGANGMIGAQLAVRRRCRRLHAAHGLRRRDRDQPAPVPQDGV